jgi:hypothetical protein
MALLAPSIVSMNSVGLIKGKGLNGIVMVIWDKQGVHFSANTSKLNLEEATPFSLT